MDAGRGMPLLAPGLPVLGEHALDHAGAQLGRLQVRDANPLDAVDRGQVGQQGLQCPPTVDVVLVVGANDVVNPAARSDKSAPIYGMPILDVDNAQQVVFLKRSMRPGFAGIENELLYDPKTTLLFGDAKDSLTKVVTSLKAW